MIPCMPDSWWKYILKTPESSVAHSPTALNRHISQSKHMALNC